MKFANEKGQTIAIVILVMVVALSVGVAVSTRFIKSLRVSVKTDDSSRAVAVAEAGVEELLGTDYDVLVDYINFGSCGDACALELVGEDGVSANANITLSMVGESSEPHQLNLTTTNIAEVSLDGYSDSTSVYICWDSPSSGDLPSISGLYVYGNEGNYEADSFGFNSIGSLYSANNFTEATSSFGYLNCASLTGKSNPKIVRIKSIYNNVKAYVVPEPGNNLPSQGVLITSVGTVNEAIRTVEVLYSKPFVPIDFDYVLFSTAEDSPLSN